MFVNYYNNDDYNNVNNDNTNNNNNYYYVKFIGYKTCLFSEKKNSTKTQPFFN